VRCTYIRISCATREPNILWYDCAPPLHIPAHSSTSSAAARLGKTQGCLRGLWRCFGGLKRFFPKVLNPIAVLYSLVLDAARKPRIFSWYDCAPLQEASSAPTDASIRRVPREKIKVSVRGTSSSTHEKRPKRARDSHDTILNVISTNSERVVPVLP